MQAARVKLIVLGTFIVLGVLARLWIFSAQITTLYWDEVAIAVDARSIAASGMDMHGNPWFQAFFPSYGDYKMPGYIWVVSLFYALLPHFDWLVRLPNLLAGIAAVFLTAFFALRLYERYHHPLKNLEKKLLLLCVAAMVAVSPWAFHFSLVGFESAFAQFLLSLSLFFVTCYFEKMKKRYLIFFVLAGSFATYTYFASQFIWLPVVLLLFVLEFCFCSKKQKQTFLLSLIFSLTAYCLLLIPMWSSPLYKANQVTRLSASSVLDMSRFVAQANEVQSVATSQLDSLIFNRRVFLAHALLGNITSHFDPNYVFFYGDKNLRHGTGNFGLFLYPSLLPFLAGVLFFFSKAKKLGLFIFAWMVVSLIPASIPVEVPHAQRSLFALVPFAVTIGIGLFELLEKRIVVGFLVLFGCAFTAAQYIEYYRVVYPVVSQTAWQASYRQLAHTAVELSNEYTSVFIQAPDSRLYLWMLLYEYTPQEVNEMRTVHNRVFTDFSKHLQLNNIHFRAEAYKNNTVDSVLLAEPGYVSSVFASKKFKELRTYQNLGYTLYAEE